MMKKTYSKPGIFFEDFTLNTGIASCKFEANHTMNSCAYEVQFGADIEFFFVSSVTACKTVEADGEHNGICYHNPEGYNIFSS